MSLNYSPYHTPAAVYHEHRDFDRLHAAPLAAGIRPHGNSRVPGRKLKIGYISADFRLHSVAYFLEPVWEHHDPEGFELFAYYNFHLQDSVTHRLQQYCDHWWDIVGQSDAEVAERIRQDEIDLLVDLTGHSANSRLLVFAHKPAPVQIAWLGYPNTTGLSTVDYRITDGFADPVGEADDFYTEQLIRLPECFSCYRAPQPCPEVAALPALENGYITFGSFHNSPKISPQVIALWARVLRAVPASHLALKNAGLRDVTRQQAMREAFAASGIAAARLHLFGHDQSPVDHLQHYHRIDIGLDPFPYNGTTTTCEALWMGVPVITLAGDTHAARVGVSQMNNLGLPNLIAASPEDYVAIALRLATDSQSLAGMRAGMRRRMAASPLMDAPRFTCNLESAYRNMWAQWCSKAPE